MIYTLTTPLPVDWQDPRIPFQQLLTLWDGSQLRTPSLNFCLLSDPSNLWFIASRAQPPEPHPKSHPKTFCPNLWECEVAELFLYDPSSDVYLEFNLAANGAWWASRFVQIRNPCENQPAFTEHIESYYRCEDRSSWRSALKISKTFLNRQIKYSSQTPVNVCAILDPSNEKFLSAAALPGLVPDFHQPGHFVQSSTMPFLEQS